jgi:dTMP kinase
MNSPTTGNQKRGRFVVFDGTDGSGKKTQMELFVEHLRGAGARVEVCDFPQYKTPSAWFVEKYLQGGYGAADEVGPYTASVFYALDRYDRSADIRRWLAEGKHVVSNRFTSSNMGHQTGKIDGAKARVEYLDWLDDFEHRLMGVPRPDSVVYLMLPPETGQLLTERRRSGAGEKMDIHEADLEHLRRAADAYQFVAQRYGWTVIECGDGRQGIRSREEIHGEVVQRLAPQFGSI